MCLALLSTFVLALEKTQAQEPEVLEPLRLGLPASAYTHIDEQGVPYGFSQRLVSSISERMGREIEIQIMPYLRTMHTLKMGQIDITWGLRIPGSSTDLPDNIIKSSAPHWTLPISYYALSESNIHFENREQASDYRTGSTRLVPKSKRILGYGKKHEYYYKDAYSIIKALRARHIDLAILDYGSAQDIAWELGVKLKKVYEFSSMEIFPLFSNASPRIKDPLALCQNYLEASAKVFEDGIFEEILNDTHMMYLLPYHSLSEATPEVCHFTRATSKADDEPEGTYP